MSRLEDFQQDLSGFLQTLEEEVLRPALVFGSTRIGARATGKYMRDAKFPRKEKELRSRLDTGPLRIVSGRLERSLVTRGRIQETGGAPEGINRIERSGKGQMRLTKGSQVPYARIHEEGGVIPVTDRMRGFFWYKYRQTGDEGWKAMALSATLHIPARPYLRPALEDTIDEISDYLARKFTETFPA